MREVTHSNDLQEILTQAINAMKTELGDKFDAVEYHKAILEHGPCKFAQLRKCVDKYIAEHK